MKCSTFTSGLITALLLPASFAAQAQTFVSGPPSWSSTSITTTGGITYFQYSARLPACHWIETGPVARSDTNLTFVAVEMEGAPCILCFDCYHTQTSATVLGDLPPGAYRLFIYSYLDPFPGPFPSLWLIRDFQVPGQTGATLQMTGSTNEVRVCLSGVTAANYILESSTNLLDWTSVRTNYGGPCTFTNNVGSGEVKFFRVQAVSGSINSP